MRTGEGRRGLWADTRGAVMAEYIVAVGACGIIVVLAIVSRSDQMLFDYVNARDLLLLPAQ